MLSRPTLCTLTLAALTGLSALTASSATLAQTVDEIVGRNIESRGGREALKAVESARLTGTYYSEGGPTPILIEYKRPGKIRLEYTYQGAPLVQAHDGELGWAAVATRRPRPLFGPSLRQLERRADMIDGILVDYRDKGSTIELVGEEEVEGTTAYKLEVTLGSGDVIHVYLDTERCLELKQEFQSEFAGKASNFTIAYGDYKEVGDILRPHSFMTTIDQMNLGRTVFSQEILIGETELNVEIDDARFAMPKMEKKAEEEGR